MKKLLLIFICFLSFEGFAQEYIILGKGNTGSTPCSGTISEYDFFNKIELNINDLGVISYRLGKKELVDDYTVRWEIDESLTNKRIVTKNNQISISQSYAYKQKCQNGTNIFFFQLPSKDGQYTVYKVRKK